MIFFEYSILVAENTDLYIVMLLLFGLFMIFSLKRQTFSIVDPMLMGGFLLTIYAATVAFLYALGYTTEFYVAQYILSSTALLIGLNLNGRPMLRREVSPKRDIEYNLFFVTIAFFYLATRFYLIVTHGVPLFLPDIDRSAFYADVGFLKTLSDFFRLCVMFFVIEKILTRKDGQKTDYKNKICIAVILMDFFLNGSKSDFSIVFFAYFIYKFYFTKSVIKIKPYIILACVVAFVLIVFIKAGGDIDLTLIDLVSAIINRADTYVYIYTSNYNDLVKYFDGNIVDFLKTILYIPLQSYGFISADSNFQFFSQQVERYIYADFVNLGPNAVYNLVGLVYLGFWGSIIYSFITGYIISFCRNKLIKYGNFSDPFMRFMFFLLQLEVVTLIGAPTLAVGVMVHSFLFIGGTYFFIVIINRIGFCAK